MPARGRAAGRPLGPPIDVGFAPGDDALYVLDFGGFEMSEDGVRATRGTGRLWRWKSWSDGLPGTSLG
ncbi:MAG: hypothetical protein QOI78_3042 [Actinomycetota bacterium]|nr:hypothetical protein [Actinomycetota bacterium]